MNFAKTQRHVQFRNIPQHKKNGNNYFKQNLRFLFKQTT